MEFLRKIQNFGFTASYNIVFGSWASLAECRAEAQWSSGPLGNTDGHGLCSPPGPQPCSTGSSLAHSLFLGVNAMHCMAERLGKGCSFTRSHPGCPAVLPAVAGALPGCLHVSASDPKQTGPCAPVGSEPEGCKHCWDPRVLGKDCTLGRNKSD